MSNPIKRLLSTNAGIGITLLRVVTGLTFAALLKDVRPLAGN